MACSCLFNAQSPSYWALFGLLTIFRLNTGSVIYMYVYIYYATRNSIRFIP
jgi:hypothetical protein